MVMNRRASDHNDDHGLHLNNSSLMLVGPPGFEPGSLGLEPSVLPWLDYGPYSFPLIFSCLGFNAYFFISVFSSMVIVEVPYLGHRFILYCGVGSHLLYDDSGLFRRMIREAESVLIDNGVFSLLRSMNQLDVKLLVKYAVKTLYKRVSLVRQLNKDVRIIIVVPDYPFDVDRNYYAYVLARQLLREYRLWDLEKMYVAHGYYCARFGGLWGHVEAEIIGVPLNTLTVVPCRQDLSFRKAWKIPTPTLFDLVEKTIRWILEWGYNRIHLLGPTGRTLKKLFNMNLLLGESCLRYVSSIDTTVYHMAPSDRVRIRRREGERGLYMIARRSREIELEWLQEWLNRIGLRLVSL